MRNEPHDSSFTGYISKMTVDLNELETVDKAQENRLNGVTLLIGREYQIILWTHSPEGLKEILDHETVLKAKDS